MSSSRESITELMKDQDFQQKSGAYVAFIFELYRVLMGSMLIVFVPQKCGDHSCGLSEHLYSGNPIYITNFSINLFTASMFFIMYLVEIKRENKMINYLEVDKFLPRDNEAVGEQLKLLPADKRETIIYLDGLYQLSGGIASIAFVINAGLSGYTVFTHYLDDKTLTVFITNVLFMALKLKDVYDIIHTPKNVFLSAYLTRKIQYNAVDPQKKIEHPVEEMEPSEDLEKQEVEQMEREDDVL